MHQLHRLFVLASAAAAITVPVFAQTSPDNPTPAQAQPAPGATTVPEAQHRPRRNQPRRNQ